MPEKRKEVLVQVNGMPVTVPAGAMVSAALLQSNAPCRSSVTGQPRTALCGMGICFECRAVIDGVAHRRTCQIPCREGMVVETMQ
ncbi:MAG: (2Fe-2S)-binding protein [Acidobacteriaceae bacterium]|nr:(2Fe-2S)-binding protein [Acidobacteriaceae bacterium]